VHIRLAMPCIEIEASGRADADADEDDACLTVANTFDALNCQVEDFVRRRCKSCSRYAESHW
jgi:hypothetical protein